MVVRSMQKWHEKYLEMSIQVEVRWSVNQCMVLEQKRYKKVHCSVLPVE